MNAHTMAKAGHHFGGRSNCFPNNISQYKYSKRMVQNPCHHNNHMKSSAITSINISVCLTHTIYFMYKVKTKFRVIIVLSLFVKLILYSSSSSKSRTSSGSRTEDLRLESSAEKRFASCIVSSSMTEASLTRRPDSRRTEGRRGRGRRPAGTANKDSTSP